MAETLYLSDTQDKKTRYEELIPQIIGLIQGESDLIANLANISAALHEAMGFFWVGFYIVRENELVLGPFQGPVACTRIARGKGVCGAAWDEDRTIVVEDVDQFPGHIACSSASRSEIVIPVHRQGKVCMILDVDSDKLADFDDTDRTYLEQLMRELENII